jgi:hypothetical protein
MVHNQELSYEFLNDCQFDQNLIASTIVNNGSNTLNVTASNTLNITSGTVINLTAPLINIGSSAQFILMGYLLNL